jgi:hypothetical protein
MAGIDSTIPITNSKAAAEALYELICNGISNLNPILLRGLQNIDILPVKEEIKKQLQVVKAFWWKNQGGAIEAWRTFWAYRSDGKLLWILKVVWGTCTHYGVVHSSFVNILLL